MALKKINEQPKITDTILLEITTPDADGCFSANPYKVDKVTIYYIERDFLGTNHGEYTKIVIPDQIEADLVAAEKEACSSPTAENLAKVAKLEAELESASHQQTFYYKERTAIKTVGTEGFPAWLSSDTDNAMLTLVEEDENGDSQFGHFTYEWHPNGSIREGDYFVCWTWTPLADGESLSAHIHFKIEGDQQAVITIPSHATETDKYEILLERYLPEMYKATISDNDLTPQITDNLNQSIAKGFTFIEDMANQVIDLFDANALHESMLNYLSNLFALKLKSNDPTLWRRQIKEAIPLFKKKGTYSGLQDAFAQAGMTLNGFTQYWQIVSPYTWTETFKVTDSPTFALQKQQIIEPIVDDNFGLWVKREDSDSFTEVSKDYVSFEVLDDGTLTMTWIGDTLSSSPVEIFSGDTIKVMYQYSEIPDGTAQAHENYIRALPLMDQRDESDQDYPPKNWNVRLIAEDDVLFDVLIPLRHPFVDPLIFGYVRTEFAYSENIYNMEEYNGSTRPSFDVCQIDKSFVDPCGACLSSSYSVDVSVEELSNDRMLEAQDILREFTPFHAQLHSMAFNGEVNEFVAPPEEHIDTLVTMDFLQNVLSGNSNPFFNRIMEGGLTDWIITRDDLTDQLTVLSGKFGTAYNDHIAFISPDHPLQSLGIMPFNHLLEVMSPSANAGSYTLSDIEGSIAKVASAVNEPVDESAFTFRISNITFQTANADLTQNDEILFADDEVNFDIIGVKTEWDVDNTPDYTGGPWKILFSAYSATPYTIKDIIGGSLVIDGDSNLPIVDTASVSYSLLDDDDNVIETSTGDMSVTRRALVDVNDPFLDVHEVVKAGDYLEYDGQQYVVTAFNGQTFWIEGYEDGDAAGVDIQIARRLVDGGTGYFGYRGLRLTTLFDHESEFEIVNGSNPPDEEDITDDNHFKENYLFKIDNEFYKIVSIDRTELVLAGREQSWGTQDSGGTSVAYSIVHFPKKQVNVGFTVFDHLDRDGQDPVIREIYSTVDDTTAITALSLPKSSGVQENVSQEEGITFTIETRDGETIEGAI